MGIGLGFLPGSALARVLAARSETKHVQTYRHRPTRTDSSHVSILIRSPPKAYAMTRTAGSLGLCRMLVAPIGHRDRLVALAVFWKHLIYLAESQAWDFGATDR